jgi:Na+/H+-dicarboxylate symporter
MGVDRIVDMGRTAVNVTGDAICTTIIAKRNNALDIETFNNMDKTE